MSSTSFHVCANCDGSCERVARAALVHRASFPDNHVFTETPWGRPDHCDVVKPGIVEYGTPSHGGWWVSQSLRAKIPACVQLATFNQNGVAGWFEEDSDVCWVVACFPDLFGKIKAEAACGVLSRTFDCLRKGMDASRERNMMLALRCAYAKNGLAYGADRIEA